MTGFRQYALPLVVGVLFAKLLVASHGPLLLYGAGVMAVVVVAALAWALFR